MERKMTVKGFITKLGKAGASAAGFLEAHREYLLNGEVSEVTAPIVQRVDSGELFPTPAIQEILSAVVNHLVVKEAKKADRSLKRKVTVKRFRVVVLDRYEQVQVDNNGDDMVKSFTMPQDAQRWADNRLFNGGPDWYAEITDNGEPWETVKRDDSIARILRKPRKSVGSNRTPKTSSLSFRPKITEKRVHFSRG